MAFDREELNKRRQERQEEQKFLQQQKKLLKLGVIFTAATLVLCAGALLTTWLVANRRQEPPTLQAPSTQAPVTTAPPTEPPPTIPDTVIHFVAGGDLNVTDKVVQSGIAVSGYDYTEMFLDVAPILAGSDLTAVNFEGSLYGAPYGTANKSAPVQLLQGLQRAGVDLLQAANSQTVVNGLSGLRQTLQGIHSAGLTPLGAFADAAEFKRTGGFVIREVQGVKIAFVAFTKGMDGMGLPAGSESCVNLLYEDYNSAYQKVDTEGITKVLRAVQAEKPDVTIALLHWGSEFNDQISKTQTKITDLMLQEGVDAIVGSHSHYVQQVKFDPVAGTLIAYSLGDFLGDGDKAGTNYSILLDIEITKNGTTGESRVTGFDYTPIFIADETATGGSLRLLRIPEAITAYENRFLGSVSKETYTAMKSALERIEARVNGK